MNPSKIITVGTTSFDLADHNDKQLREIRELIRMELKRRLYRRQAARAAK